jgi:DNA ligase (NAD+)
MDIDGMGTAIVDQLVKRELVADFADLYHLDVSTLAALDRLAEKSAGNLVTAIDRSRERGLARLLHGLGIRHVGERVAFILARQYHTMDNLMQASAAELAEIDDIGPIIAESVYQFFSQEENQRTIERLRAAGVKLDELMAASNAAPVAQTLAGKVFVLTGSLPNLTRNEARDLITAAGGKVTSSVTRKTDYVVAGHDPGSKYQQAERLSIPILDEDSLHQLLQAAGS